MTTEPLAEASDLHAHVFTLARLLKSADKALVILRVHELLQAQGFRALEDRKWVSYPLADWHEQHFTWAGDCANLFGRLEMTTLPKIL